MSNLKNVKGTSKYKENKLASIKEFNTLDNKHRLIVKQFNELKNEKSKIDEEIKSITDEINDLDKHRDTFTSLDIKKRASLLDKKDQLELQINNIDLNHNEMDYYDNTGDIISDYYNIRDNKEDVVKESKNIINFLCNKKEKEKENNENVEIKNKAKLFEKFCHIVEGIRLNRDDGSNRIKYCSECNIEKILDLTESSYICNYCGDSEMIILDEDRQIKDYSPYRRLNHFREWLNQFQAKQTPDIPEQVFYNIIKELNKKRITDLSTLNKKNMKEILKKLGYNIYYEHIAYIINKLNNLPPPKITRDMEKLFISMFFKIQDPWEKYKQPNRQNFLSYSYVLHKFCELL